MVDPNLGKYVCDIYFIPCACPYFLLNLIKIGGLIVIRHLHQYMLILKVSIKKKYLNITMIGLSCNSYTITPIIHNWQRVWFNLFFAAFFFQVLSGIIKKVPSLKMTVEF